MRHIKKILTISTMAITLSVATPKAAVAQVACPSNDELTAALKGLFDEAIEQGKGALKEVLSGTGTVVTPVADIRTHHLLTEQTARFTSQMKSLIKTQTAICENIYAMLNATGFAGGDQLKNINLPLFAQKAYTGYVAISRAPVGETVAGGVGSNSNGYASGAFEDAVRSGVIEKKPSTLKVIDSYTDTPLQTIGGGLRQQPKQEAKPPVGQRNIPETFRAGNSNTIGDTSGLTQGSVLGDVQSGLADSVAQSEQFSKELDNLIGQGQAEIDKIFSDNGEISKVLGDLTGGYVDSISELLNPEKLLGDVFGDVLGGFGLGEIFDIVDSIQTIIENVQLVAQNFKGFIEGGLFDIPTVDEVANLALDAAMGPIKQAEAEFMGRLTELTDIRTIRDQARAAAKNPGNTSAVAAAMGDTNPAIRETQEEWGIVPVQETAVDIEIDAGGRACLPGLEDRVKAKCEADNAPLQRIKARNVARNHAARAQTYLSGMDAFRKKLIFGDELSGECKDFEKDEECQTIMGFMQRSINLRQDTMVQSAIMYTNLLVDMMQLEAAAWDSYVEGWNQVYSRSGASGSF